VILEYQDPGCQEQPQADLVLRKGRAKPTIVEMSLAGDPRWLVGFFCDQLQVLLGLFARVVLAYLSWFAVVGFRFGCGVFGFGDG
jgi:hypothetical protein